jgi:hypothetical protein
MKRDTLNRIKKKSDLYTLLGSNVYLMTEEQQIQEIRLEADAHGLLDEVERRAALSTWGSTKLDKYQDAYLLTKYGTPQRL